MDKQDKKMEINLHYDSEDEEEIINSCKEINDEEEFDKMFDVLERTLDDIKQLCKDKNCDLFANTTTLSLFQFVNSK